MPAVSGSTNYSQNVDSIIKDALILLGVAGPNTTPSSGTSEVCRRALNRMIKSWDQQGMHLWTQHEAAVVFDVGVAKYTLPSAELAGQSVGVCNEDVFVQTTLSAAEAAAQTVLSITDTTGMAATDKIIIQLDDDTRHETTIVSVDSATQVTITAALASAAASGNFVYSYPVTVNDDNFFNAKQIYNVRLRDPNGYERGLYELGREGYYALSHRTDAGTPSQYYLDDQLTNKSISLYPVPDNIQYSLRFTYTKSLDDADSLTDLMEFPSCWLDALIYGLAVRIAPAFGKEDKALKFIAPLAKEYLREALFYDDEKVDVQIQPNLDVQD